MSPKTKAWIEAMRLRTLPVSVAGTIAGTGCACLYGGFRLLPALICLLFAIVAQIASNFANEYYDFANGLDKKGREGFRRGVTEGDISPGAMKRATFLLLALDCLLGCSLIYYGGWWLVPIGAAIALFAVAYSGGPWPLSHHGLGDVAVFIFFGIVPVTLTAWLQTGTWDMGPAVAEVAAAIGLMGVNVLIVNNYRDADDDRGVGKRTTVVRFGRKTMASVYLANGWIAWMLYAFAYMEMPLPWWGSVVPALYIVRHIELCKRLRTRRGAALNPLLKSTALAMLMLAVASAILMALYPLEGCPPRPPR